MSFGEKAKAFYRWFRWVALAVTLILLLLILRQSPPPYVQSDPQAAERVNWKIHQLENARAHGEPHTLEFDEAELNSFLRANLALAPGEPATASEPSSAEEPTIEQLQSTVRDVRINLLDDRVRAYLVFDLYGKDVSLEMEGRLEVRDGYLRLVPTSGRLGSLPIPPGTLDNAVRRLFDSEENREKFRMPAEIQDIRVENRRLQVVSR